MSDDVTVLVFNDDHVARTFNVPRRWFAKLGILLSFAGIVTTLSVGSTLYFWWKAHRSNPEHVIDLEQEVDELRHRLSNSSAPTVNPPPSAVPVLPPGVTASDLAANAAKSSNSPTDSNGPTSPPTAGNSTANHLAATNSATGDSSAGESKTTQDLAPGAPFFAWLPLIKADPPSLPNSIPFKLTPGKVSWKGKSLHVTSSLQYTATDGGKQEGRIIILGRGPSLIAAYPAGALGTETSDAIISPQKGEFFSVSRFRAIDADLGPFENRGSIAQVAILILDSSGKALSREVVHVNAR